LLSDLTRNGSPGSGNHRGAVRIAVLDVDGTLLPGSLGLHMLREIAGRDATKEPAVNHVLDLHASYVGGGIEYSEMASSAIRHFCHTLNGLARSDIQEIAARVWRDRYAEVFAFVWPLVGLLDRHGIEPVIVSSSPEPAVACVAAALGVARYRGSRFSTAGGAYDGAGYDSPYFMGKHRTVESLCPDWTIDWRRSLAIGNSLGDVPVLSRAGLPFAFEPEAGLLAEAQRRRWPVVFRADVLESVSDVLDREG
jgi:phosphoserine phosphatase